MRRFHFWHPIGICRGSAASDADTDIFSDMALIAELHQPTIAMVPVGDRFTMGPPSAARAVGMVRPRIAIPMHYNTWPPIEQDPKVWKELAEKEAPETELVILEPGASYELQ